ncbi:hypothetical protein [Streptomyces sp. AC512_CC834]|uniref:hypothetical protein n=1 Tax=Streptomyces sp. AC512_CC834 TaxID=2823691 RepID=UPI001C257B58|nr:hypothetical protein [Streptomyces sp. AC512_CC834]
MPKPIRMSRRMWAAAWAVLCAAGLAATAALNASSVPDQQLEKPVGTECAEYIADVEVRLAEAGQEGRGGEVLAFSRVRAGTENDCGEELRNHFGGAR